MGDMSGQLNTNRLVKFVEWGDGLIGAPVIIEDQYRVYKHPDNKMVVLKAEPSIYYVNGVEFISDFIAAWQK